MKQLMKTSIIALFLPTIALSLSACSTTSSNSKIQAGDNQRIDGVMWNKQVTVDINEILNKEVANDKTRLVFMRKYDNDAEQSRANISVNDRFQVSLHPGNYTVVESCVGTNQLSANVTGFKDNNLLANQQTYELTGGQTYFYYVDVDDNSQSSLKPITNESALTFLENKRYQSHQISRVVPNCPPPVVYAQPIIPKPVIVPVLAEKAVIDLEVLFETDQSNVRPNYYSKIADVGAFMTKYANASAVIEGHTDSRASDSYNQALSQRRVEAVREVLINQFGIAAERVNAIGYGESQPRASNDTAEGRQLNRRVVAVIEEDSKNR